MGVVPRTPDRPERTTFDSETARVQSRDCAFAKESEREMCGVSQQCNQSRVRSSPEMHVPRRLHVTMHTRQVPRNLEKG